MLLLGKDQSLRCSRDYMPIEISPEDQHIVEMQLLIIPYFRKTALMVLVKRSPEPSPLQDLCLRLVPNCVHFLRFLFPGFQFAVVPLLWRPFQATLSTKVQPVKLDFQVFVFVFQFILSDDSTRRRSDYSRQMFPFFTKLDHVVTHSVGKLMMSLLAQCQKQKCIHLVNEWTEQSYDESTV